jgi:hypothetical protein
LVRRLAAEDPATVARLKGFLEENKRQNRFPQLTDSEFRQLVQYAKSLTPDFAKPVNPPDQAGGQAGSPAPASPKVGTSPWLQRYLREQAGKGKGLGIVPVAPEDETDGTPRLSTKRILDSILREQAGNGPYVRPGLGMLPDRSRRWQTTFLTENPRERVRTLSTKDMHLFHVSHRGNGVDIAYQDGSVALTTEQVRQLKSGVPLADDHPLSELLKTYDQGAFVLYTGGSGALPQAVRESDTIAFAIQKAYPKNRVYRDPYSERTAQNTRRLNDFSVSSTADFVTLVAGHSFAVRDWKIVKNIAPDLRARGFHDIRVLEAGNVPVWTDGGGKTVSVITGHIDAKLIGFVEELGRAGYFRNNLVLLNTCRDTPTRDLLTRINSEFGAAAVFSYDGKLGAAAVENFLVDLADSIRSKPTARLVDMIRVKMHRHGLNGTWIICHGSRSERPVADVICQHVRSSPLRHDDSRG